MPEPVIRPESPEIGWVQRALKGNLNREESVKRFLTPFRLCSVFTPQTSPPWSAATVPPFAPLRRPGQEAAGAGVAGREGGGAGRLSGSAFGWRINRRKTRETVRIP